MTMADRPERPTRGKLTPPANTDVDPIDARPVASRPQPAQPAPSRESSPAEGKGASAPAAAPSAVSQDDRDIPVSQSASKATVQSGISWSLETEELVRRAKNRTGKTRKAIVEEAIAAMWARG